MIILLSSPGLANIKHSGRPRAASEGTCHVQVTEHVPDRARQPGPGGRDHRAGLARGHGARAGHPVRRDAFIAAGLQAARAFSSATAGPVIGHLLLGPAGLAAGMAALAWPGPTALVLVLIVGLRAVIAEIAAAFQGRASRDTGDARPGGLVTAASGVALCARPGTGTVALALLLGLLNHLRGLDARPGHRAAPDRQDSARRHAGKEPA